VTWFTPRKKQETVGRDRRLIFGVQTMANHSYVTIGEKLKGDEAERVLREVVFSTFDPTLFMVTQREDLEPFWQKARVWWVHIPGSAPGNRKQPDDYGFLVFYRVRKKMWEFRHPLNGWERWCQEKVKYLIAQRFKAIILDDADDKVRKANGKEAQEVLQHVTYGGYLSRNLKKPLNEGDRAWVQGLVDVYAPPGHRTLE
jgi:hypothetical protein